MRQHGGNWKALLQLFWTFFRIAPLSFGGGFAMIPVFEREIIHKRGWVSEEELADVLAASQTIPGAVAINSSAMIGYRLQGIAGAIAAAAGMMMPTFFIVLALGIGFANLQGHFKIQAAMEGVKPAIVALIAYAGYRIYKTSISDKTSIGIMIVTVIVLLMQWASPTLVIILGGMIAMAIVFVLKKLGRQPSTRLVSVKYAPDDSFFGDGI